ncbi:copper homeostasis protein [Silvibacterium bohemicum]|uniref:PF03932 family protein CutC n=1 Tax=Silvibacterium bohemicum TaxID=1577686 RepID=A0A841JTX2_9BACT|nr:copper homeostasis protein CutC [Silvibacterium bohemicum]MBB6143927.1 copper homeostasis protein [Silvibacterium bohemicum]
MAGTREIVFELCAESVEACVAGQRGGADRIELCTALIEDGLTPSHGLVQVALNSCSLPIHILLRPRAGDFEYSDAEFSVMKEDLVHLKKLGVSGFVIGILHADATVDIERTRELVELAAPLEVTFNRAFDYTASLWQALEDVIAAGCRRVLTAGGEPDVVSGAVALASLVEQAAGRAQIAVGGGLRIDQAADIARVTHATHFHGSLRQMEANASTSITGAASEVTSILRARGVIDSEDVRALVTELRFS